MFSMTATPMMLQWQECKKLAKEALLLFRLGDFYEAFHEDAQILSKELHLTLTARQQVPMCGVPFHAAEGYIDKLLAKGYKVAIAEQVEDPKAAKGLVKREITQIITPATLTSSQLLSDKKNNFFVSIISLGTVFGIAVLDLSTTEFRAYELEKETHLIDELCRLKPKELLVSEEFPFLKELSFHFPFLVNKRNPLSPNLAFQVLTAHFDTKNLDSFGLKGKTAAISAAGALLLYLKEELNLALEQIQNIENDSLHRYLQIDRTTMRHLDIEDSLLSLLDETSTAMGGRQLRQWVQYPLLSLEEIHQRQKEIAFYLGHPELSQKLRDLLSHVRDLERLTLRITMKSGSPRDVYALGFSLSFLPAIQQALSLTPFFDAKPLSDKILHSLNETLPLRIGEGDLFRDGYHPELDHLRKLSKDSMSWMLQYQARLREETQIRTLKVGYTKAFGYYIEVSHAQSDKIPSTFQRRQTLVNAERFLTAELKEFEHQVLTAEERAKAIEVELFEALRKEVALYAQQIKAAAKTIARIDALLSLAKVAALHQWICPQLDESDQLDICQGRHPVVEQAIGQASFLPNDTHLDPNQQLLLITGPNMAGKSTYIRQVAILVILAQMGSYIPAKSARIGLIDKVFSRIGASDDLARGQSTFMVEMTETAHILQNATSRSLVLLDEIGRGTSTYDGISIAWAVAEYLLTTPRKQAKTLFATHYWELTKLEQEYPHAANFQTAVQENSSDITFLRKIIRGGTNKSYGIHVAKLAGLPSKVLKRAEEMLKELEKKPTEQLPLFVPLPQNHPLLSLLKQLDPLHLTPLEAQHKLFELKSLSDLL